MNAEPQAIRSYRLMAHHLDQKLPMAGLEQAAGACGLQNSPPGSWETALFNRLQGCTLQSLQDALYRHKRLVQAWSYRGVPAVFPTAESDVFLSPLAALPGEEPWIYTRGVTAALDFAQLSFGELLPLVKKAAAFLNGHTVKSKEELDRVLAALVEQDLPPQKRALWNAPSMYGSPDRQTVGGAAVSFLLRPCSFAGLVVFGERQGASPTFTSFRSWVGREMQPVAHAGNLLVRKFLHCYGPAAPADLAAWLGCSPAQGRRLWGGVQQELEPVHTGSKTRWLLASDLERLRCAGGGGGLLLLGPHDPYLDTQDRALLVEDKALQRLVWRTVANPGVILENGRAAGIWKAKSQGGRLELTLTTWAPLPPAQARRLEELAEQYAAFRQARLQACRFEPLA
ncbi:winged helix DNA-binding domain-containing protein [Allofournierella sp.]|uniref:winged helix DNA-binding domain-containing protein n=2 Tax=Allofournierella sp. TaxID=1940256 RepID=UPI003AF86E0E